MNTQTALRRCFNYFMDMNHEPGYRNGGCVYYANGSDPVRCAIGCLIPKRYQVRVGKVSGGAETLFRKMPELKRIFADVDEETLIAMQFCHDRWAHSIAKFGDKTSTREIFLDNLQSLMCFHENDA